MHKNTFAVDWALKTNYLSIYAQKSTLENADIYKNTLKLQDCFCLIWVGVFLDVSVQLSQVRGVVSILF